MASIDDFLKTLGGTFGKDRDPAINQAFDLWVDFDKTAADGMASTATADTFIWSNPFDFPLFVVSGTMITLGAGLTVDNTNFATVTVKTDNGAGGATATALTINTTVTELATSFTSNIRKAFTTLTAANQAVASGANLFFNIAKTGTGVVVPISAYQIRLRRGAL